MVELTLEAQKAFKNSEGKCHFCGEKVDLLSLNQSMPGGWKPQFKVVCCFDCDGHSDELPVDELHDSCEKGESFV